MHFRDRGNSIQFVRTTYDAASKKPKSDVLGSMKRGTTEIDPAIRSKMTPEEVAEFTTYIGHETRRIEVEREHAAMSLPGSISHAIAWLETKSEEEIAAYSDYLGKSLSKLRRKVSGTKPKDSKKIA